MKISAALITLALSGTMAVLSGCRDFNCAGFGPSVNPTVVPNPGYYTWKTVSSGGVDVHLVKIKLDQIGLTQSSGTEEGPEPTSGAIYNAAIAHGLKTCTPQEAQDLRAQYTDQPHGEFLILLGTPDASGAMTMPVVGSYPMLVPGQLDQWLSPLTTSIGDSYTYRYGDMHWYVFKQ